MEYLPSIIKQFEYYKKLGDRCFIQLTDEDIQWRPEPDSNSISIIVKHIVGNMLSRFTNFFTEDGEKPWRHRETEFENAYKTIAELTTAWEDGWKVLFDLLNKMTESDLDKLVYIRNQGHTVTEALNRQLAHYAYHIGQIVYIAKVIKGGSWESLSIPKGGSTTFNQEKFQHHKSRRHFTEDL